MKSEERIMGFLARFVIRYRWLVLSAGLIIFILSLFAAANIQVETEIKDLLPEENPQIQSYAEIDDLFAGGNNILVTLQGGTRKEMAEAAEEFVGMVREEPVIMDNLRAINLKLERDFIDAWGLMLQKPSDLERTQKQFSRLNLLPFLTALNDSFEEVYTGDDPEEEISNSRKESEAVGMLNQMELFFTQLGGYLSDEPGAGENADSRTAVAGLNTDDSSAAGETLAETFLYGESYGFSPDYSMLMFVMSADFDAVDFERIMPVMEELDEIRKEVEGNHPLVEIGFTGEIPIQADEQKALGFDLMVPALVAVLLILVLFLFSFDQLRSIIFIIVTLIIGVVYNYGFLGITVGSINMLTSMMAVLLIGLGVDYGIQVVTNFNTYRREGKDPEEALTLTYKRAGMGIFLAALTTSIAFFVMAATGSQAFSEFGMVLGTGILLCFLAMFFVLPAFLLILGKKNFKKTWMPNIRYQFLARVGKAVHRKRKTTLFLGIVVTGILLYTAFTGNQMDYDLMAMEPQDMPSIVQYRKIMEKYDITPFQSMVVVDSVEEARRITEELEDVSLVGEVNSISYLMPPADEQAERLEGIRRIRNMPARYADLTYSDEDLDELLYEIQRVEWNIIEIGDLSVAGLGEDNKILTKRNEMIREIFGAEVGEPGNEVFQNLITLIESDREKALEKINQLDDSFAPSMDAIVTRMARADRPMEIPDLPLSIQNNYFTPDRSKNLVMIFPVQGIWENINNIHRFNEVMENVSEDITGTTQITTAWLDEATGATLKSALFITLAVLLFLLLSFRSLRYTLLAAAPLVVGMIWMLGLYPLLGFKMNILNIIVIPLVIGMGIDFGIHLAHRFQVEQDVDAVYRYTGKAVFLSALTTMIGFGSLGLIGKFPSIASMGTILFFGIASCLATSLLILPALFSFGNNHKEKIK